jgi:hypothetical protein
LTVSNHEAHKFDGEILKLRKLNELAVTKHYQTEFINRFATLQNLSDGGEINWV